MVAKARQPKRIEHRLGEPVANDDIDGCKQGKRGSETVPCDENAGDTGFGADFVDGFEQIISYAVVIVEKALVHLAVGTFLQRRVNASEFEICNPISERLASAEANYNDFVLVIESDEALNVNTGFIGPGCLEVTRCGVARGAGPCFDLIQVAAGHFCKMESFVSKGFIVSCNGLCASTGNQAKKGKSDPQDHLRPAIGIARRIAKRPSKYPISRDRCPHQGPAAAAAAASQL